MSKSIDVSEQVDSSNRKWIVAPLGNIYGII